jgi:hypothetical protein
MDLSFQRTNFGLAVQIVSELARVRQLTGSICVLSTVSIIFASDGAAQRYINVSEAPPTSHKATSTQPSAEDARYQLMNRNYGVKSVQLIGLMWTKKSRNSIVAVGDPTGVSDSSPGLLQISGQSANVICYQTSGSCTSSLNMEQYRGQLL